VVLHDQYLKIRILGTNFFEQLQATKHPTAVSTWHDQVNHQGCRCGIRLRNRLEKRVVIGKDVNRRLTFLQQAGNLLSGFRVIIDNDEIARWFRF
jgi:hypothetical protein